MVKNGIAQTTAEKCVRAAEPTLVRKGRTMAQTQSMKTNMPRLMTLLLALIGCLVVAVPMMFPLTQPIPLVLVGSGVTVLALACFLFFSI